MIKAVQLIIICLCTQGICVCVCISLYTYMHMCASVYTWCVHLSVTVMWTTPYERVTVDMCVCVHAHACDCVHGRGHCCRLCGSTCVPVRVGPGQHAEIRQKVSTPGPQVGQHRWEERFHPFPGDGFRPRTTL